MHDRVVTRIEAGLAAIASDRSSGSAELAAAGVALLVDVAAVASAARADPLPPCRAVARRLCALRPGMAAPGNWAAQLVTELAARTSEDRPWLGAAQAIEQRRAEIARRLVVGTCDVLAPPCAKVLTLSYSSTIARAMAGLGRPIDVVVAEARPLFEGRKLAEELLGAGHRISMITDAAIAGAAGEVDAVLIGADAVCRDGAAINKTGSLAAALGAARARVPLYVVADRFKFEPDRAGRDMPLERMDGGEIWPERPDRCRNVYFEPVPADLITAFITDCGVRTPAELAPLFDEITALRRNLNET